MIPIAFNENNTSFLNFETGVVLIFAIFLLILATFHNIRKFSDTHNWKNTVITQIVLALCAVLVFTGFTAYKDYKIDTVEQLMLQQIESSQKVEELKILDKTSIYCDETYTESINAATWTKNDVQKTGLLIGQKKDDECRFVVEETVRENVLDEL